MPADLGSNTPLPPRGRKALLTRESLTRRHCNATVISERFSPGLASYAGYTGVIFISPTPPSKSPFNGSLSVSRISEKRGISVGKCHEDRRVASGHILPINLPLSIERKTAGGREWKEDGVVDIGLAWHIRVHVEKWPFHHI